mgnify:CR=1 FL=1
MESEESDCSVSQQGGGNQPLNPNTLVLMAHLSLASSEGQQTNLLEALAIREACRALVGSDGERECARRSIEAMLQSQQVASQLRAATERHQIAGASEVVELGLMKCDDLHLRGIVRDWSGVRDCYIDLVKWLIDLIDRNSPPEENR